MKADMSIELCGIKFKNPMIAASGALGYGEEYEKFFPLSTFGGIATKGITLKAKLGKDAHRIAELEGGLLNSMDLQNLGVEHFISEILPWLKTRGTVVIVNIAGSTVDEYAQMVKMLDKTCIDMIELNMSCQNVEDAHAAFETDPKIVEQLVKRVKENTKKPLIVKFSPFLKDIKGVSLAAKEQGADCLSLVNACLGMRIDINTRRPIFKNNVGGLSGPAIFPIALWCVYEASSCVDIPIIGGGGIKSAQEAIEMMTAGATAFSIGSALFRNPSAAVEMIKGIEKFMENNSIYDLKEIVGSVKPY